MKSLILGAALILLAACARDPASPTAPSAEGKGIQVQARAVPLDPTDPKHDRLGDFVYAGGLELTSQDTPRLHGLSDLKVAANGDLISQSDEGDLLRARLKLDDQGRPQGLDGARMSVLTGPDGKALQGKREADSEGIALLANGDMLVSFEEDARILLYPAAGGPPWLAPSPDAKFPMNQGMEALAAFPPAGPDAYVVGGEASGETWVCRLSGGCVSHGTVPKPPEYGLSAVAPLPGNRIAYLLRAWDPVRGARIRVLILDDKGAEVTRMDLGRPLTVDNFEGLAAVPGADGTIRFYLISDDNFSNDQRTLLLAFDWSPKAPSTKPH